MSAEEYVIRLNSFQSYWQQFEETQDDIQLATEDKEQIKLEATSGVDTENVFT